MSIPELPVAADSLIPHRPPMRWIESLVECTDTEARATIRFSNDHFAVEGDSILESALVECIAQTVAAGLGFRARQNGATDKPGAGMLAAVSSFTIHSKPPLDTSFDVHVKEIKRLGPMLMVSGRISCNGRAIASGELSLYA